MIKNQRKLNSSGFSLVELIVAIAIMAIVGTIVMYFVSSGTKQYQKTGDSVKLQNEAQLAMDQIQDLVIDATDGVNYSVGGLLVTGDAVAPAGGEKKLLVYNKETVAVVSGGSVSTQYSCLEVRWDSGQQKLYYSEYKLQKPDGISTTWTQTDEVKDALLAEYVTDFSIDLSNLETNHMVSVKMNFQVGNEKFEAKKNITVRNPVVVNGETEDDIFK